MAAKPYFLLFCASLGACNIAPKIAMNRDAVARQISDDAVAFNEAYGNAVTGQILLNILRARDRLPRFYLTTTGISDSPSIRYRENFGIGSVPLGDRQSQWGIGALNWERESQSRPSYAVQPFTAEALGRVAFRETDGDVFARYWGLQANRDIALLLLVDSVVEWRGGRTRRAERILLNDPETIAGDCGEAAPSSGCEYVVWARNFEGALRGLQPNLRFNARATEVCGLIFSYGDANVRPPDRRPDGSAEACGPSIAFGDSVYEFRLRSFDQIVSYIGALLRDDLSENGARLAEAPVTVGAAGLRQEIEARVPLFRLLAASEERTLRSHSYAATVVYRGERYVAGPPVSRACEGAAYDGPCQMDAVLGDRTSTVISMIAELMALNQSPEAVRAPNRMIVQ